MGIGEIAWERFLAEHLCTLTLRFIQPSLRSARLFLVAPLRCATGLRQQGVVLLLRGTARVNSCPDTCDLDLMTLLRRRESRLVFSRGVRHWTQLSTHLRQKGYKQDWMHDFIASE